MELNNNIVISVSELRELTRLLDGTDFHGFDFDKGESLMTFGFVYDSQTGEVISTLPLYVWEEKGCPIRFGVKGLSKEMIDEVFEQNSVELLTENEMSPIEWDDMCDSFKINIIEQSTGGLELRNVPMDMDIHDLFEYLKTKI